MRVILLEDVKGVGRKLDVKEVREGYARNFLIPKKLAEAATPNSLKKLIRQKSEEEAKKKERIEFLTKKTEEIQGKVFPFKVATGEKGEVFGSVSGRDIEHTLHDKGVTNTRVNLAKPLKALGEHEVEVDLGEGVKTKIKISVF